MNELDSIVQEEINRFSSFIDAKSDQPGIYVISSSSESPVERFFDIIIKSGIIYAYIPFEEDINKIVQEMESNVIKKKNIIIKISFDDKNSLQHLETNLKKAYNLLSIRYDVRVIFCLKNIQNEIILNICKMNQIPKFLIKNYELGSVGKDLFINWLKSNIPMKIGGEALELIFDGTGKDFSKANTLISALFGKQKSKMYFVTMENEIITEGKFPFGPNQTLTSSAGKELMIPVKFFIFDSSCFLNTNFPAFIRLVKNGEFIYPNFLMKEIHSLEEKYKRRDRTKANLLKQNVELLIKSMNRVEFRRFQNSEKLVLSSTDKLASLARFIASLRSFLNLKLL